MCTYTWNNKTYSEQQVFELMMRELDNNPQLINLRSAIYKLDPTPIEIIDQLQKEGEEAQKIQQKDKLQYISTTSFITAEHILNLGTDKRKRFTPKYNSNGSREAEYIKEHISDIAFNGNEEAVKTAYNLMIESEEENSKVGDYIHKLVHVLLTEEQKEKSAEYSNLLKEIESELKKNDYKFAKIITENSNRTHTDIVSIRYQFEQQAKNIVNWINSNYKGKITKIYSELPMVLKNKPGVNLKCIDENNAPRDYKGLFGIADLVIVDSDNKIHLIDYKICSRPYNEWYTAKKNEVEYQLAIYRAILADSNIDGNDIDLIIKPVLFPKGNIFALQEESAEDALKASNARSSRIAWINGKFTANLRELGIGIKPTFKKSELTNIEEKIQTDYNKILGFTKDPQEITKEWFIDNEKIVPDKDANGKIIGYKFWNKILGKWIKSDSKDEILKPNGLLEEYISNLKLDRDDIFKTIIKEIEEFKDPKHKITSFLNSDHSPERKTLLNQVLGKYTTEEWECKNSEFPDALSDHGILIFSKKDIDTGEQIIDLITLAPFELETRVEINDNSNLLGKYLTNEQSKQLSINALPSLYKNVKGLETLSIFNTILNETPNLLQNYRLNRFTILNVHGQVEDNSSISLEDLIDNFNFLCEPERGNLTNQIKKLKIPTIYEQSMIDLQDILTQLSPDDDLKMLLSDIDHGSQSLAIKKKRVLQLLQTMRDKYPQVRAIDGSKKTKWDMSDPVQFCYIMLVQMNNWLHGIHVNFNGTTNKYGVGMGELLSFLGVTFFGKFKETLEDGSLNPGLLGGTELSSPTTMQSSTLRQIFDYYNLVYQNVRSEFMKETQFIINLNKNYVKNFRNSTQAFLSNDNIKIFERLLVHDADGKVSKELLIKNPYDKSNDLTELDREFLKQYLWEINKYRLDSSELDRTWHYKDHKMNIETSDAFKSATEDNDSLYFQLPLARSDSFQRIVTLSDYGLNNWIEAKKKDFDEIADPRRLHNVRVEQIKKANDITTMYNNYAMNKAERLRLLESVDNPYDFSFDLDFLACDVAFQTIRKEHFDEALMLTETALTMMSMVEQNTGADLSTDKEALTTQKKINLTGEPTSSKEVQRISRPIQVLRDLNSKVMLACRPFSFIKELSYGMFVNFSRAWSLKFGSNPLSLSTVTKASTIVWGQKISQTKNVILGESDIADFTLCQQLNRFYGIANEDLNRFSKNSSMSRTGRIANSSKYMYIAQSAPDYYNRLTLFIAKMLEDGCFDAHTLNEDGSLRYDWKKDKRFSELVAHGLNSNYTSETYNKQKALYVTMCQEFETENVNLIKWNAQTKQYEYGDLPQAYTSKQRSSIKEVADIAYGFYDHETKSQLNHKFFGLFFLQFQTFLSAKFNLYFKAPGKNTAQGKFVEMVRNGEKYYHVVDFDENGKILYEGPKAASECTPEQLQNCLPQLEWKGDYTEGLMWSVLYTLHDIFTLHWKDIATNKYRLANVGLALYEIGLGIILVTILKAIFSNGTNKKSNIKPVQRVLIRSLEDVGPYAFSQVQLTPSFINTWSQFKTDGLKLLAGSDDALKQLTKDIGATRDFIWDEN